MRKSSAPRRQPIVEMFPYRQSADGCPLCVICGMELRRKDGLHRRADARYCSKACREDAQVRSGNTAVIRGLLLERDKGICSSCALECVAHRIAFARPGLRAGEHTWQAHHILSVVDGGGGCGIEGYATLCLRCHKRASAELAARRARPSNDGEPVGQMGLPFA